MKVTASTGADEGLRLVDALDVEGLSAGYGDTMVLRNVSLRIPAAEVVALFGANGAGKTTLLRAISGLIAARTGSIHTAGREVTHSRASERARSGLCHIPEGRGVYRTLSVRENLVVQAPRRGAREAIERGLAAFPILGTCLGQTAGTLSGGEQQMLALAAAYVRAPSLILVDEPSLGLAPMVVDAIFEFLAQRSRESTAILLVDQFVGRVLELANYAYVLRRGAVVFRGRAAELCEEDLFHHYLGSEPGSAR